jgi:hypothetical protein
MIRIIGAVVLGVLGGFLTGLLLSQVIGIAGLVLLGQAVGIKYLPIMTAIAGAILAPIAAIRRRRQGNTSSERPPRV